MSEEPLHESHLLERYLRTRSSETFTALMEAHRQLVLSVAFNCLRDREAAEDVTQELFLSLIQRPPPPGTIANERAFLARRTIQTALSWRRGEMRRRRREKKAARAEVQPPDSERSALASRIREALHTLPERIRLPLYLHFFEGFGVEEVALALGCHRNTVSCRIKRGKELLKRRIPPVALALLVGTGLKPLKAAPEIIPSEELLRALEEIARKAGSRGTAVSHVARSKKGAALKAAAGKLGAVLLCLLVAGAGYLGASRLYGSLDLPGLVLTSPKLIAVEYHALPKPNIARTDQRTRIAQETKSSFSVADLPIDYWTGQPSIIVRVPWFPSRNPEGHFSVVYGFYGTLRENYPGVTTEYIGGNWEINVPRLDIFPSNLVIVNVPEIAYYFFDYDSELGTWQYRWQKCRNGGRLVLDENAEEPVFIYETPKGSTWYFHASGPLKGRIFRMADSKGEIARFFYYDRGYGRYSHHLRAIYLPRSSLFWQFYYLSANGTLQEVRMGKGGEIRASMQLEYYLRPVPHVGGQEDLKRITVREKAPQSDSSREHTVFFRYWTELSESGRPHALKYVIGDENFRKLAAKYGTEELEKLSDEQIDGGDPENPVRLFDCYFEYNIARVDSRLQERVGAAVLNPGSGVYFNRKKPPKPGLWEFKYAVSPEEMAQEPFLTAFYTAPGGITTRIEIDRYGKVLSERKVERRSGPGTEDKAETEIRENTRHKVRLNTQKTPKRM